MSRLTYSQGYAVNLKGMPTDVTCEEYCANIPFGNGCDGCLIDKAICKLAHYEDLEEQGRLIELPCKMGDYVYKIHNNDWKQFLRGEGRELEIIKSVFTYKDIPCIGTLVFLTKEAAEAKLAEMEGAENDS